jgi:hypothetical protein
VAKNEGRFCSINNFKWANFHISPTSHGRKLGVSASDGHENHETRQLAHLAHRVCFSHDHVVDRVLAFVEILAVIDASLKA